LHADFNKDNALKVPLTLARAAGAQIDKFGKDDGVTESLSAIVA
jgi:hypothetical protein